MQIWTQIFHIIPVYDSFKSLFVLNAQAMKISNI